MFLADPALYEGDVELNPVKGDGSIHAIASDGVMGDDDDGGVGSQQPGDALLLPHYICRYVDSEVLAGMHVNEEEEATWNTPAD
ncbi:hypothetical protein THAOC_06976 [Thalassiosira oceanica]|uniref:Uncharacterized protein n=1 Tax=Thalassiosira oceanica TaxID=159749 RepID=K0TDJ2_THAOC|nr:hypothetical protein THAOC_06976 [Thalassiosira oceanica]|eukprot:EJK71566.1 hypothetical protein THAOC_06976 [Thalassiosira oceanica]